MCYNGICLFEIVKILCCGYRAHVATLHSFLAYEKETDTIDDPPFSEYQLYIFFEANMEAHDILTW